MPSISKDFVFGTGTGQRHQLYPLLHRILLRDIFGSLGVCSLGKIVRKVTEGESPLLEMETRRGSDHRVTMRRRHPKKMERSTRRDANAATMGATIYPSRKDCAGGMGQRTWSIATDASPKAAIITFSRADCAVHMGQR